MKIRLHKRIPLTQGQFAIVSDEDFDELSKFKWYAKWDPKMKSYYAARQIHLTDGKWRMELMHCRILGLAYGDKLQGDHVNHNTLDNRRSNLRITTARGNHENRRDRSKYGVGIQCLPGNLKKPFQAQVRFDGKKHHVGMFATPEEAQVARIIWLESRL